ncbi:SPOR domain-containing protein [Halioglobus sp. Uisw_031]|jgi:cell division septation protein DedD|uniref:SPOR domain-containing protein n=1 Tax=Halioglobus sp. Uisw_031 TaxID=3230977 RepID=UPI0039EC352B
MSKDNHEGSDGDSETSPDVESKNKQQRHESGFGGFNANDEYEYEEPDRDIDYSSSYSTDSEDEGFDDASSDDEEQDAFSFEEEGEEEYESDQTLAGEPDDWLENEDNDNDETEDSTQSWPLGLIAVAAVALMLLAAGGYGVIQERAETVEELRQLRETLTTVTSLDDAGVSQKALQTLKQSYDGLTINAEALMRENRRLTNAVAELEIQLEASQALLPASNKVIVTSVSAETQRSASNSADPVAPKPSTPVFVSPQPAAVTASLTASSGAWFVNVSSYSTRAAAEKWVDKVRPDAGKVIVSASTREGKTYYRVRVIGLANKSAAAQVARKLEAELTLDKLWVGHE